MQSRSEVKSLSRVQLFATPWTVADQAPQSMGFSRHEYWSGLPFPSPGDLRTQGLNPGLLHCRQTLFHLSYQGSPMWNARMDEAQAGIKIAGRNINNLRHADGTTFMAESEEELKSFLIKVKEESEKVGLKLNIQKMKNMASNPITSWKIDWETMGTVKDFIFFRLQNHCRRWLQPWD